MPTFHLAFEWRESHRGNNRLVRGRRGTSRQWEGWLYWHWSAYPLALSGDTPMRSLSTVRSHIPPARLSVGKDLQNTMRVGLQACQVVIMMIDQRAGLGQKCKNYTEGEPLCRIAPRNNLRFCTALPRPATRKDPIAIAPADWPATTFYVEEPYATN